MNGQPPQKPIVVARIPWLVDAFVAEMIKLV
jgi:hypothetical protein